MYRLYQSLAGAWTAQGVAEYMGNLRCTVLYLWLVRGLAKEFPDYGGPEYKYGEIDMYRLHF